MRLLAVLLAAALATGAVVSTAGAVKPDIQHFTYDNVTEVIPAGELCSFDVQITSSGRFRVATYVDKDGSVTKVMQNPSLRDTLSANGKSFESSDRGLDKITFNPDGTVTVHGTGIHLKVKGEYSMIGLWVLTFDGTTGDLLNAEYHGNFDSAIEGIADFVCAALA